MERKVSEILASRAAVKAVEAVQVTAAPLSPPHAQGPLPGLKEDAGINDEVRRRLEALEQRIEQERRGNGARDESKLGRHEFLASRGFPSSVHEHGLTDSATSADRPRGWSDLCLLP